MLPKLNKVSINKLTLITIIGLHYVVFISFTLSATLSFFLFPWYVAIAITSLITRVIFDGLECPLTTLENKYRSKLGIIPSKGFLKDFVVFPKRTIKMLISKLK